jgi:hypothetical protein
MSRQVGDKTSRYTLPNPPWRGKQESDLSVELFVHGPLPLDPYTEAMTNTGTIRCYGDFSTWSYVPWPPGTSQPYPCTTVLDDCLAPLMGRSVPL